MSHEAIVYGVVIGPLCKKSGEVRELQLLNETTLQNLPEDDDWPWFDKSSFSLPGKYPKATFRSQVLHFGFSMKDDPRNYCENRSFYYRKMTSTLLRKFEEILRQLHWSSARLHFETDFESRKEYTWVPLESSKVEMFSEPPKAIKKWIKSERILSGENLHVI